jgi:alcohol dehydrogenase class IV
MKLQKLIRGNGSLAEAAAIIREHAHENVILVCGNHFYKAISPEFLAGLQVQYLIKQGSNVNKSEMQEAIERFLPMNNPAILAIGGGSVIDLAKTLRTSKNFTSSLFIAVPTTMGSGSEATHFAVVYEEGKKNSLVNPDFLPGVVILDPSLGESLTRYQLASSGMDVAAQAIESYWSRQSNETSRSFSIAAMKKWNAAFSEITATNTESLRLEMLDAAYAAGQAINITRTTGAHALSYFLTSEFNIPHGHAVGLLLPLFFEYNNAGAAICQLVNAEDTSAAIEFLKQTMESAGLATTLAALNIDKHKIMDQWLNEVNEERFSNNPVAFDRDRLSQLINKHL